MINILKLATLVFYGAAILSFAGALPSHELLIYLPQIAVAVVAVHMVEAIVMIKKVRLYKGPFIVSLLLTLIFGGFHLYTVVAEGRAPK